MKLAATESLLQQKQPPRTQQVRLVGRTGQHASRKHCRRCRKIYPRLLGQRSSARWAVLRSGSRALAGVGVQAPGLMISTIDPTRLPRLHDSEQRIRPSTLLWANSTVGARERGNHLVGVDSALELVASMGGRFGCIARRGPPTGQPWQTVLDVFAEASAPVSLTPGSAGCAFAVGATDTHQSNRVLPSEESLRETRHRCARTYWSHYADSGIALDWSEDLRTVLQRAAPHHLPGADLRPGPALPQTEPWRAACILAKASMRSATSDRMCWMP